MTLFLSFQLKALSHYANEQIEVAVSFASKPEIVTNIRQRNIEVSRSDCQGEDTLGRKMFELDPMFEIG